ncbi:hypothetical protein Pan153_06310 [Gimesia panareensis]|uniref:Uncharacterized protein n=1 Tax=Gimesia panareensis TaxID=2527978 RepID=A0A518FI45_9PLAN|nr:hypothetical protein Pan153_06310 [Gimesia panareensis]
MPTGLIRWSLSDFRLLNNAFKLGYYASSIQNNRVLAFHDSADDVCGERR